MIIMLKYDSYQDLVYKFMMALNEGAGILHLDNNERIKSIYFH